MTLKEIKLKRGQVVYFISTTDKNGERLYLSPCVGRLWTKDRESAKAYTNEQEAHKVADQVGGRVRYKERLI